MNIQKILILLKNQTVIRPIKRQELLKNTVYRLQHRLQKPLCNAVDDLAQAIIILVLIVERHLIRRMAHQGGLVAV